MKQRIILFLLVVVFVSMGWKMCAVAEDDKTFSVISLTESMAMSGGLEVEAGYSKDFSDTANSDISLATMELAFEAQINEWFSVHALLLWEEDDTEPIDLDEGSINIGGNETCPLYFTAGKIYIPFGLYESNMVSDPLTLEIGEMRESAIQIGTEANGFYGSVYLFNGDVPEDSSDEDDHIETFGANAGYTYKKDSVNFDVGFGYISNIIDSDTFQDGFSEAQTEFMELNANGFFGLKSYVAGIDVYAVINYGPVCFIVEYVSALDDPEYNRNDGAGTSDVIKQDAPAAIHFEGAVTVPAFGDKNVTIAATYQGTDNLAGALPEGRIGVSARVLLADNLCAGMEYVHDEDYDTKDGGTGETADALTLQMAVGF